MKMKTTTTTAADIADLVEFSINEAKPQIKTRRGSGSEIELRIGRSRFTVSVQKPQRNKNIKEMKNGK